MPSPRQRALAGSVSPESVTLRKAVPDQSDHGCVDDRRRAKRELLRSAQQRMSRSLSGSNPTRRAGTLPSRESTGGRFVAGGAGLRCRARWQSAAASAGATAVALLAAGCGGSGDSAAPSAALQHVHGLGVNPKDGALMIATHTGLFRMAPGGGAPARVGDRHQDTMGFAVVGPDRFLGSGHPDLRDDLPPLLGLIRSSNAGGSWQSVSLLGSADFHRIRVAGTDVIAIDSTSGLLMVSRDVGSTWRRLRPPEPLVDVAPDPSNTRRLVATSATSAFTSVDGGGSWRRLDGPAGLIAWPSPNRLFAIDATGRVLLSTARGNSFRAVGAIGGEPAAFHGDGAALVAARHDGAILRSTDEGRSWETILSS